MPCALAGGILRTGHFAGANWCRGLSAGDAWQQLWPDPALRSRPSRCLRLAGEERVVGSLGPPGFAGQHSAAPHPHPPRAPFSWGRRVVGVGGVSGTCSAAPGLSDSVLLLSAKRQSKEGKGLQSSDVVRRCPETLFPIVISGGGGGLWGG